MTTRTIQNYESGTTVPWRHLGHIELNTRKRSGWHHALLRDHLTMLRVHTDRLREQREIRQHSSRVRNGG